MWNSEQIHQLYTELRLQDMLSGLITGAAENGSLEGMVAAFHKELSLPVILCDALHMVLAVSKDVRSMCGADISWDRMIALSLVPDVHMPADGQLPERQPEEPDREITLGGFLKLHLQENRDAGLYYIMCDVFESEHLILKLTVSSPLEFTELQLSAAILFGAALQLAYCRSHRELTTASSEHAKFLVALLNHSPESQSLKWSHLYRSFQGEHLLVCVTLQDIGMYYRHFTDFLNRHISERCIAVQDGTYLTVLVSGCSAAAAEEKLHAYAQTQKLKLAVSEIYTDLDRTAEFYVQQKELLQLLAGFRYLTGVFCEADFRMYRMFERIYSSDPTGTFVHADAILLASHDDENGTEYTRTLFAWMLCNRKISAAAAQLYLHRNTVDQRLSRIHEMIHADWNNPSYLYAMLYSCYIIQRDHKALDLFRETPERREEA